MNSIKLDQILIVDDDERFTAFLSEVLADVCDKVYCANTVEKGKSFLYQYDFKIIFLDINLKGRNGAEIIKFLVDNPLNKNSKAKFVIMSGMIEQSFIEKNKDCFLAVVKKPFEVDGVITLVKKTILQSEDNKNYVDDIPVVYCEKPFHNPQLSRTLESFLANGIKIDSKSRNLLSELKNLKGDEIKLLDHIGKVINVACTLALKLDWNKDNLLEKLMLAAYFHDFSLRQRPDLLHFNSFEEVNAWQKELGVQSYFLTINHPENTAKMLQTLEEFPSEVLDMIRTHHELPDGKGFPAKLDHNKLSALSALFISAHDYVEFCEARSDWDLKVYLKERKNFFIGHNFKKILKCFEQL